MNKLRERINQLIIFLTYIYYKCYVAIIKAKKYINSWIISERGKEARDNGYFFYNYLCNSHPEIDCYYVIAKDSPDLKKIKGEYIIYGSKEHYIAFLSAKVLISTHLMGFSPNMGIFNKLQKNGKLHLNGKIVSLKHGITKDFIASLNPIDTKLDLLIAGALPEYNYLINTNGFNNDVVKYTGFARFDTLKNSKTDSNIILIMPTFRKWMTWYNNEDFIKSSFYINYNELLNNKAFIKYLNENDLQVIFYMHFEFQKYSHLFNEYDSRIKIATLKEYDVQDLLIKSKVLITDYSSVFFDFGYMQKPIIYFQFDYDDYRQNHYKNGYFDYSENGFGPLTSNIEQLLMELTNIKNNDFKITSKYKSQIEKFFTKIDSNNCSRIYQEIIKKID